MGLEQDATGRGVTVAVRTAAPAIAFVARFASCSAAGLLLYAVGWFDWLVDLLRTVESHLVGLAFAWNGASVAVAGNRVALPGVFGIEIVPACTGTAELILFTGAIWAYPASRWMRLQGALLAAAAIVLGNVVRLTSLVALGVADRAAAEVLHAYVWRAVTFAVLLGVWWVWFRSVPRAHS